jgi:predicted RNA-binding protein
MMCLARAYLRGNGAEEVLSENVASVEAANGKVVVTTILHEKKEIAAAIVKVDFADSIILLELKD